MLYLILGNNKDKNDQKIEEIGGDLPILKMDPFNFDPDLLRGELQSKSLFSAITASGEDEKNIVIDGVFENEEFFEFLKNFSAILVLSEKNVFIIENDLLKEEKEFFEKAGAEIFDLKDKKTFEYEYSPFALQDAIGSKNAKNSWIEYQKLRLSGIEPEEIVHKIVSKVRDMNAINLGAEMADLGMKKDFPFNKSKRDTKNWKEEDLKNLYTKLVSLYHQSRMGGEELDSAIEKTLLKL